MKQNERAERKFKRLYQMAAEKNVIIDENCPNSILGIAIKPPGKHMAMVISIPPSEADTAPYTRLEILAHEMGHCATGGFYDAFATKKDREAAEHLADLWAGIAIAPTEEIGEALDLGCETCEDFAEFLGTSVRFMEKTLAAFLNGERERFLKWGERLNKLSKLKREEGAI